MRERPRADAPQSSPFNCSGRGDKKGCVLLSMAISLIVAGCWAISPAWRERYLYLGGTKQGDNTPVASSPEVTEALLGDEPELREKSPDSAQLKHGEDESRPSFFSPKCFFSPEADPSEGSWRPCPHGVRDSPAFAQDDGWELPDSHFYFLKKCDLAWNRKSGGHGDKVPRPYWSWEPAKCSLDAVDEVKFCRAMKGRLGILLVGDSLTRLMTSTLASVLRANAVDLDIFQDSWEACGGELKMRFVRNDYLDARTTPPYSSPKCEHGVGKGPPADNTRCHIFANDDTLREYDTLVVNSGAHPRPAEEFGKQMNASSQALTSAMHRLHGKGKAILVVRNTVPGHWGCTSRIFDGPVDAALAKELVDEAPDEYQWKTFHSRNDQLEKAFSADKGWRLLDAYTPTILRADSHIGGSDCLHWCSPGPADHWVTLLYNIILAATDGA